MKVDGVRELVKALRSELARARRSVASAVADTAGRIAAAAQSDAPAESGRLRASIHATPAEERGGGVSARVECEGGHDGEPVAAAVEFGTRHEPARPFLRPAADRESARFPAAVAEALGR